MYDIIIRGSIDTNQWGQVTVGTEVLLNVPDDVYSRVERLAQKSQREVADVILDSITHTFAPFPVDPNRAAMSKNVEAYQAIHPDLLKTYLGQYVAICDGQLLDHDSDPVVLLKRIRAQHPNKVVLRRKVEAIPEPQIHIRHPRVESQE